MPCFHGLAVSIHTPDGPLPEYSIQKQSRAHRITSYIPVPPPKIPPGSTKPEQSTFAISITLLTPGLNVPYSTPKPTPDDPFPRPKIVGGLAGQGNDRGKYGPVIGPYMPLTSSPNETIAAYIYFDGRAKEEVATLLRRGEETWVNSRWVSVPESEGGGLAEREFLFREVGLERWLNGLDLEGKDKDVAAKIQRRKERLEKKRRKKREEKMGSDDDDDEQGRRGSVGKNGVLRYGEDKTAPVETLSGDDSLFTTDSDSDDEPPMPEAAGQIKVALFRVLASGEIKRGEYSPQFDAHDDDESAVPNGGSGTDGDVDHTTSFAKPKTLDPKSISTQTVTGIDPQDKPYAVFTFLYRGERQLRKMGILQSEVAKAPVVTKRGSTSLDFSALKPLTTSGTKNFAGYRDGDAKASGFPDAKSKKKRHDDEMDSDVDDDEKGADDDNEADAKDDGKRLLSPEDALRQGELAEGVRKIKLKRQHSAEPLAHASPGATGSASSTPADAPSLLKSPLSPQESSAVTQPNGSSSNSAPTTTAPTPSLSGPDIPPEAVVGSPFKKQRASLPGFEDGIRRGLFSKGVAEASAGIAAVTGAVGSPSTGTAGSPPPESAILKHEMSEDEEL